jgi:hypothetical protein
VDDFRVCSDLCEENGFARPAELLRSLAEGRGKAYLVVEREYGYNDENYYIDPGRGNPRSLFFDRGEAEREAAARNAQRLRELSIASFGWFNLGSTDADDDPEDAREKDYEQHYARQEEEMARQVGEALGQEFRREDFYEPLGQLPGPPTDEQMLRLARFLDAEFYYVVETEFAG